MSEPAYFAVSSITRARWLVTRSSPVAASRVSGRCETLMSALSGTAPHSAAIASASARVGTTSTALAGVRMGLPSSRMRWPPSPGSTAVSL